MNDITKIQDAEKHLRLLLQSLQLEKADIKHLLRDEKHYATASKTHNEGKEEKLSQSIEKEQLRFLKLLLKTLYHFTTGMDDMLAVEKDTGHTSSHEHFSDKEMDAVRQIMHWLKVLAHEEQK